MGRAVTFETGFARTPNEAEYPHLFPDCGWWCPSLQPRGGATLWDLSGCGRHGTLTNMDPGSDWVLREGRATLDLDNVNDKVVLPSISFGTTSFSVSAWAFTRANNTSPLPEIFSTRNTGNSGGSIPGVTLGKFGISGAGDIRFAVESSNGRFKTVLYGGVWNNNEWNHWLATYRAADATMRLYKDGKLLTATSSSASSPTPAGLTISGATSSTIGSRPNADRPLNGQFDDLRLFGTELTGSDATMLYQLGPGYMPAKRRRRYVFLDTQETVTGDAAVTLAAATATASGTQTISGTSSTTLAAATSAATGAQTISGSLASTLAAATATATGSQTHSGTAAATTGPATSAASGTQTIGGTAAVTLASATCSASGTQGTGILGTVEVTLAPATAAATGSQTYSGTAAATTAPATTTATGTQTYAGSCVAGTGAASCSASGSQTFSGTGSSSLAAATATATGSVSGLPISGTVAVTLGAATATISGVVIGIAGPVFAVEVVGRSLTLEAGGETIRVQAETPRTATTVR